MIMPRCFRQSFIILALAIPLSAYGIRDISASFIETHAERLQALFLQLDQGHPEIAPIRSLWEAGERLPAARQLSSWYEHKSFPVEILEPLSFPEDLTERADAALLNRFFLIDEIVRVPMRETGGLDWSWRGADNDKEHAWMLNRHQMLPELAEAFRRTGRDLYRAKVNDLLEDWILNNAYPDRLTFSEAWRALEVARRILNVWVHLFYQEALIDPQTRLLMLSSVLDHADSLREHASFWGGNHLITEKIALLTLATAWPELESAQEWNAYAIERLEEQFFNQTYPDGSYKELSNHYQRVVLVNARNFLRLLAHSDPRWRDRAILARIERMWEFFAWSMQPDGSGPLSNASDREANADFVSWNVDFFNRPDWLYLCTNGQAGTPPATPPSRLFPWAGQAFLRSGWERDAHWVYFDAGPYGTGHQHVDHLHLSATLHGRPLLADSGRYTYVPGPWRDYFKGPAGHNTLKLNKTASVQPPREVSTPLPVGFVDQPEFALSWAQTTFQTDSPALPVNPFPRLVPWTRIVFLHKAGSLIVIDHLRTFHPCRVEADWHFHPDVSLEKAKAVLHPLGAAARLSLSAHHGTSSPHVNGFYSPQYGVRYPAPALRYAGILRQPTAFVWHFQDPEHTPHAVDLLSDPEDPVLRLRLSTPDRVPMRLLIRVHPEVEVLSFEPDAGAK